MQRNARQRAVLPAALAVTAFALGWRFVPDLVSADRSVSPRIEEAESEGRSPGGGDYFAVRLTYPTGRFDSRWLLAAAEEHRALPAGVPAGARRTREAMSRSPLGLDPDAFTSLGPQPLEGQFGRSAGRTNVIVSDPVDPAVAYFGSNGGGVWKTTQLLRSRDDLDAGDRRPADRDHRHRRHRDRPRRSRRRSTPAPATCATAPSRSGRGHAQERPTRARPGRCSAPTSSSPHLSRAARPVSPSTRRSARSRRSAE